MQYICIKMDITCVKGDKILLTDHCSQTFAGVVKSINTELGRILLTDVVQLPEHKSISGYRNFDKDEIVEIKIFGGDADKTDDVHDEVQKGGLTQKHAPVAELSQLECDRLKKLQNEYRLIRDFGTNFHASISLLRTSPIIGVYAKDVSKGRFKRASVMAISTPTNIFVYDIQMLGDDSLHKGLKEILESPNIVKVVHDCRLLSDCLKHKHLMNLENVRDIEAEDVMVVFQERRKIRMHSRSLEYLCKLYLGVSGCKENGDEWNERPLAQNLLEHLVSFSSLLVPLHQAIERKYLQLLIDASNIYNNHLRSLDLFSTLFNQPNKTLRKELCKLLAPRNQARSEYRTKDCS